MGNAAKKSILKKIGLVLGTILVVYAALYFFPVPDRPDKPYFMNERPLVIAHQGGELIAPSNTMIAFEQAYEMGVDVLEFDIHMTKDGHLVLIHDDTVDRTTNGAGRVDSYTLEELQKLDAGYHFRDLNGELSYRGVEGAYIPTVEEMFKRFPSMRMNIEIKDTYPKGADSQIEYKLWELIQKYGMAEKVLVVSFDHEIIRRFDSFAKGKVALAGGRDEIKSFVIFHKLFLNGLYRPEVDAIQIPIEDSGFDLTDRKLINGAHKKICRFIIGQSMTKNKCAIC